MSRSDRLYDGNDGGDSARHRYRSPWQRDRDRILYTSAFRRLSGVTQVASAAEGTIFHNRMTHSLEVAQVGKSIALVVHERDGSTPEGERIIEHFGGLS